MLIDPEDGDSILGGWRNGYPKFGGMTLIAGVAVIEPMPSVGLRPIGDLRADIPPVIVELRSEGRTVPIPSLPRAVKERPPIPSVRDGAKPANIPA
jgi:hypothetical protein